MAKITKTTTSEALYAGLRCAMVELAKSVDVAVARMALRAKFTAVISDAAKAERAVALLRAVATKSTEAQEQTALFAKEAIAIKPCLGDIGTLNSNASETAEECDTITGGSLVPPQAPNAKVNGCKGESAIAMRILELHDRFGGFIK